MKTRDIEDIQRSQALAQSGTPELLAAEEAKVLTGLVSSYSSGKLTDRDAAVGVAVIAHLRALNRKAQQAITRGIDAGHKITR